MNWYTESIKEIIDQFNTNIDTGLTESEAKLRLDKYGPNELEEKAAHSKWLILLDQFKETMVIILIIAAIISLLLGEYTDAVVIIFIVIMNALLGYSQEYKAEQAMEALKKLAVPIVRVRRDGRVKEISATTLVPGDIVLLEAGNYVPADCRLFESMNLKAQESALTGESEPIAKISEKLDGKDIALADRKNMVYMGTNIVHGRGQGIVVSTGMQTELGSIAGLLNQTESERTPLQKRLDQLGKGLALAALVLVGIIFVMGWIRGEDLKILFMTSISIAVAAIPEGLPAIVTITLALGARRMLQRNALIRRLPAVEALGSVTTICSDKTGTLTENRMTVTVLDVAENRIDLTEEELKVPVRDVKANYYSVVPDPKQVSIMQRNPALTLLLAGGSLCNDAILDCPEEHCDRLQIVGDPTEGALLLAAASMGLMKDKLEEIFPRVYELPFDSNRKRMTTVHKMPKQVEKIPESYETVWDWEGWIDDIDYVAFTKGAIDGLIEIIDRIWVDDHIEEIDESWITRIESANRDLAQSGMRVLGVACRSLDGIPKGEDEQEVERDLIFVGLVGMIDPARPEVKDAVRTCRTAGIRPIMITGDHPLTARYIAKELGIIPNDDEYENILTGQKLDKLDKEELRENVLKTSVYARVTPEDKLNIVGALQDQGEIAAMTGDGVNDAPALKKADIGVAMGITGTDVSKEASDMVLLDDNFATIVAAIEEGRVIYDNIRKFIQYTLSSNMGEIWIMLLAPILGMPLPLLPLQILWINLVTDGLPGLALSVEKGESDTMKRPPYPPEANIFARGLGSSIIWVGILMGGVALGVGYIYWLRGIPYWQTMIFTTITLSEMGYVLAIRSYRDSLFSIGIFSNRALIGAVLITTLLQLIVIYVPFLQGVFKTSALPWQDLVICFLASTVVFIAVEILKWVKRRKQPVLV